MVVSVKPFEVIAGPADVWTAPEGEAFTAINVTPPAGLWASLGRTEGGVSVQHNQNINLLRVDQTIFPVKAIRTEIGVTVTMSLAEITLETYAKTLNDNTVNTTGVERNFAMAAGVDVARFAMLIRGPSPYGEASQVTDWFLQYQLPVVIQGGSPSVSFTRDDKAVLDTEWMALEDPDAAEVDKFGKIVARESA